MSAHRDMAEWLRAWPGWAAGALSTDEIDRVGEAASMLADLEQGVAFWRDESMALTRRLTEAKAQLGNAVGAVIDSGGCCEGPHDVAAAIYRLTEDRDALRSAADRALAEIDNSCWYDAEAILSDALARKPDPAAGGAPGVSETHTDPKEEQQ